MLRTQVLIAGAGPTGLMLASQLARYGIDFRIVDPRSGPMQEPRALGVQARTLELLETLELADAVVDAGRAVLNGNLYVHGRRVQKIALGESAQGLTRFPFLLVLEQGRIETLLHERLQCAGRQVDWNWTLTDEHPDEDGIVARLRDADHVEQTLTADWLVACDGASSGVRERLGLAFAGGDYEQPFFVADARVGGGLPAGEMAIGLSPEAFAALLPLPGAQRYRIVGMLPGRNGQGGGPLRTAEVETTLRSQFDVRLYLSEVTRLEAYRVHHRCVECFRHGRVLFAGDAAHVHSPVSAQGMNTGVQDACNLAWKLALVALGRADVALLDSYHEERWGLAQRLLQTTDKALRLILGRESLLKTLRVRIFPWLIAGLVRRERLFPLISQIEVHYRDSSLSRSAAKLRVAVGQRLPHVEIRPSPSSPPGLPIFRWLAAPGFHVLMLQREGAGLDTQADFWRTCLGQSHPGLFQVHALTEWDGTRALFEALGVGERALILVRPDQHLAYADPHFDLPALGSYLDEVLGLVMEGAVRA